MFQQIREIIVKTIVILFVCVFMCSISYCGYFGGAGGGVDIPTGDGEWFRLDATNGPLTGKTIIDHNDGGAAGHQLQLTSATSDEVAMVFFDDADTDDAWFYGMESTGQGTISWWNNSNFPVSPNNFVLRMELDAAGTLRLNSTTQPQIEFQSFVSGSPANATGSTRAKLYFRNPNRLHSRDNVGGENKYSIDTEVMLLDGTNAMTGALDHGHNASDNLTQSTYEDSATPTVRATISAADHGFNEGLLFNFDQVGEVHHALRLQHSTAGYLQLEMVNDSGQELNIGWVHDQDAWGWYHSGAAEPAYFSVTGSALATAGIILQVDDTVDIRGLTLANAMDANGQTISNASSLELDDGVTANPVTCAHLDQNSFTCTNSNPAGSAMTAYGVNAGINSTGNGTAVGFSALLDNISGVNNSAYGGAALQDHLGNNATGMGFQAGLNVTAAGNSSLYGARSGRDTATISESLVMGMDTGRNMTSITSSVLLGNGVGEGQALALVDSIGIAGGDSGTSAKFVTGANELIVGSENAAILEAYIGEGGRSGNVVAETTIGSSLTTGTNIAGPTFNIAARGGTGNAAPGSVCLQSAVAGVSGTADQAVADRLCADSSAIKAFEDLSYVANGRGPILVAPDAGCWRVTVDNAGTLGTTSVTCP